MGWALIFVVTGWEAFLSIITRRKRPWLFALLAAFAAVNLATLANPYGFRLHVFLYETLKLSPDITEWRRLPLLDFSFIEVKALMLLFLAAAILDRKNVRGWEFWAVAMTFYASLKFQRHTPFFALAVTPFLSAHLSALAERVRGRNPGLRLSPASLAILSGALLVMAFWQVERGVRAYAATGCRIYVSPAAYPIGGVRFIRENGIRGNLLVPFDWGEYALWHLYPGCLVSIDGRFTTSYPPAVIAAHFVADRDERGWKRLVEKYPADVIISRQIPYFQKLVAARSPEWIYVYSDPVSIVFLRNNAKNREALARFRAGGFKYSNQPLRPFFP